MNADAGMRAGSEAYDMMRNHQSEDPAVKTCALAGTALLAMFLSGVCVAQVPPDIAAGIHRIGPIVEAPDTAKLYALLFQNQEEPYPNVSGTRGIAHCPDPLDTLGL